MDDTSSDIAIKVRDLFQSKTPMERMEMGFSMYETSKYLVARSIHENTPVYSCAELRQELFLRFYGNDFDPVERQKIFDSFNSSGQNLNIGNFDHIPALEKKQAWWRCLEPLIKARLSRNNPENSKLLKILDSQTRLRTWRDVKNSIEIALESVKNGERILAQTSAIKKSDDPDGIIDDMFGELRTVPYLLCKGFYNISYTRRDGLDFTAEFDGKIFYIETAYVDGPDFKTQQYLFTNSGADNSPIYKIRPDKLIRLFERTYSNKKKQVLRHQGTAHNTLIFMISDLEETNASWLDHAKIQGNHPLLHLILSWEIPSVIFGCSVYEPLPDALGGIFGALQSFDRGKFSLVK